MKRKAQGALEYLFIIAAVLIVIFLVARHVLDIGKSSGSFANTTASNITQELNETLQEYASE